MMKIGVFAAALASCAVSASADAHAQTIGDATYATSTNVDDILAVSAQACALKDALGGGDWAKVEAAYVGTVLQEAALSVDVDGYYTDSGAAYGDKNWIDTGLLHAIKNTGDFAKMPGDSAGARAEATEKGAVDQIAAKMLFHHLSTAVGSTDAATVVAHWDKAYTAYMGKDMKCAIYARAQKRASNYNTWSAADPKIASANHKVLKAFADGAAAVKAGELDKLKGMLEIIVGEFHAVYVQASLRYLYLLDNDVLEGASTSDHQGEGMAFWKNIAFMYGGDASLKEHLEAINKAYDLTVAPTGSSRYCAGKALFEGKHGDDCAKTPDGLVCSPVTTKMIGTFEFDDKWSCPEGKPKGGADSKATPSAPKSDDDSSSSLITIFGLPALVAMTLGAAHML